MPTNKLDPLVQAIRIGDKVAVEHLLRENPELRRAVLPGAATPLLLALYHGRADVAGVIMAHDATLDIFEACAMGELEQVKKCAEKAPGSVNSFATDGYFSLGLAAFFGHASVVRFLLDSGADVNQAAQNAARVTALHGAVTRGTTEIVQMLLEWGASPNARQEGGFVPLHSAAAAGHEAIVHLLVDHGADVSPLSDQGKTPRDFAIERGKSSLADWLKQRESPEK